jgi:hypothetical protein
MKTNDKANANRFGRIGLRVAMAVSIAAILGFMVFGTAAVASAETMIGLSPLNMNRPEFSPNQALPVSRPLLMSLSPRTRVLVLARFVGPLKSPRLEIANKLVSNSVQFRLERAKYGAAHLRWYSWTRTPYMRYPEQGRNARPASF